MFGNTGNQGASIEVKTSTVRMEDGKEYMKFTFPDAATKEGVSNLLDERFANYSDRDTPDKKSLDLFVPVGVEQGTDNVQNAQSIISEKYNPQFKAEAPQQSVSQSQTGKAHMADFAEFRKLQEQRDAAKSQEQKEAQGVPQGLGSEYSHAPVTTTKVQPEEQKEPKGVPEGLPFGSTNAASLTGRQPVQVAPVAEPEKATETLGSRIWNAIKKPFRAFRDAFKKEEKTEEKVTPQVAATGKSDAVVAKDVSQGQYVNFSASVEETKPHDAPARDSYYNIPPVGDPGPRSNPGDTPAPPTDVVLPPSGQYVNFSAATTSPNPSQGQYAQFSAATEGQNPSQGQYANFSSVTDQASRDQQGKVDQAELKSAIEGLKDVKGDLVKPSGPTQSPQSQDKSTKPVVGAATAALNRQSNAAPSQGRE